MNSNCAKPKGDKVTVLDVIDRGELDTEFFPTDATSSIFSPAYYRKLPYTTIVNDFIAKEAPQFAGSLTFEIGSGAADLIESAIVQIELDHWLPQHIQRALASGSYVYDPTGETPWTYINSMGTAVIESASLQINELEIERIDGDFVYTWASLYSDANTQYGLATDGLGIMHYSKLRQPFIYPTTNGILNCVLPFSFQRMRRHAAFPLASVKDGSVRIVVTLRPFHDVVQRVDGSPASCTDTPCGKTFRFLDGSGAAIEYTVGSVPPHPKRTSLVIYGAVTAGKFRSALLKSAFEKIYREVYTYRFSEPLKYVVNKTADAITVQLPLELNNPCEEIVWFIRRRAAEDANEWTNYGAVRWLELDSVYNPQAPMLISASLQINGQSITEEEPEYYYRRNAAEAHKGGIIAYDRYIYGYSFSKAPERRQPTGHVNMSRANSIRLNLTIESGYGEWSVVVFGLAMNWLRFENGIANKLYSS
jgi:hypothetical protein